MMLCQHSESRKFETSKSRVEGRKSKIDDFAYSMWRGGGGGHSTTGLSKMV